MLNVVSDPAAFDPSTKHVFFEESGVTFEVRFAMGVGWPGSVKALHPTYRHLGMLNWGDEDRARQIAREYFAEKSV